MVKTSIAPAERHRIPVIDRMMEVLEQLEAREAGVSITDLTAHLELPRTTIYRILNTLHHHDVVRRNANGTYRLGRRLLLLAGHVADDIRDRDIARILQPQLDGLAMQLQEGCKLSVLDGEGVLVIAAVQGGREYALTVAPGQRMPVHAGAASKLLLAFQSVEGQATWLARPLVAYTAKTITDPKRLGTELSRIRRLGWAQDRGETAPSVHALAAPVRDGNGETLAALSVPYLAGAEPSRVEEIRMATISAAEAMSATMSAVG